MGSSSGNSDTLIFTGVHNTVVASIVATFYVDTVSIPSIIAFTVLILKAGS